jgi:tripartite-type tricarboxylate transporter receptor subunit TctC
MEIVKHSRRRFLYLGSGAAVLTGAPSIASAQGYPTRPVHWIVAAAPAGGNDIFARLMAEWLSSRLGQPFIVENRPGGSNNIGTEVVVRAPPDGYTLLLTSSNNASNAALYHNLNFDFMRDIAQVVGIARTTLVMVINPSVPAATVSEFVAYAKANPGKVNMGSAGTGGIGHLAGELFKMTAGVDLTHVPYHGNGPALVGLLGGEVQVLFPSLASSISYMKAGRLRGLGVTSAVRSQTMPDLPSIGESVPGYELSTWYGMGAPSGTPIEIIDRLNKEINAGLADAKLKARFADLGDVPLAMTPAEFREFTANEIAKLTKVVQFAGIKID